MSKEFTKIRRQQTFKVTHLYSFPCKFRSLTCMVMPVLFVGRDLHCGVGMSGGFPYLRHCRRGTPTGPWPPVFVVSVNLIHVAPLPDRACSGRVGVPAHHRADAISVDGSHGARRQLELTTKIALLAVLPATTAFRVRSRSPPPSSHVHDDGN